MANRGNHIVNLNHTDANPDAGKISVLEERSSSNNVINKASGLINSFLDSEIDEMGSVTDESADNPSAKSDDPGNTLADHGIITKPRTVHEYYTEPDLNLLFEDGPEEYLPFDAITPPVENVLVIPSARADAADGTMDPMDRLTPIAPDGSDLDDEIIVTQREEAGFESVDDLIKMKAGNYRLSKWWHSVRQKVLAAYGYRCVVCREAAREVHHLSYLHLGREVWCDVVALCHKHHRLAHHPEDRGGGRPPDFLEKEL